MKKRIGVLLAILCFALPALAEAVNPFAPYVLTAPEGVELTENEGTHTFVAGSTRVVAMTISRVPDENPADALIRMMAQFEPDAVIGEDLAMSEGFYGLEAITADRFGEGVDQLTIMVLSDSGELLILSGYDLEGDEDKVERLLLELLILVTVDEAVVFPVAG